MQPIRLKLTYDLLKDYGVFDGPKLQVVEGREASDDELMLIHSPEYVDAIRRISETGEESMDTYEYGIGYGDNPAFKGIHESSSLIAGSSIVAVDLVMSGEADHAINIAGGLHHAMRDRASGFCIYNDCAMAAEHAAKAYGARVAYLDIDAHHGDGVQVAFYDRSDVLTISLHEDGKFLFPGTGFVNEVGTGEGEGYSVNCPLEPGTYDRLYIAAFKQIVPQIIRAFKPDLIISENGCDTHYTDPLAGLSLTTDAYEYLYAMIHHLAHEVCDGRLVALGGGGYQAFQVVPRAWALLSAGLADIHLDDYTPVSWQSVCSKSAMAACPVKLRDKTLLTLGHPDSLERRVSGVVQKVHEKVFPYFGLSKDAVS
jgi:acetoin utilization protein AcuC